MALQRDKHLFFQRKRFFVSYGGPHDYDRGWQGGEKLMIGRIALANMKYHKSKNILTGIAIFLTTMLLFVVPTIGYDMILGERAGINELFPTWHALFREVNEETAQKMAAHHLVKCHGLRSDVGYKKTEDADIAMIDMLPSK